MNTTRTAHATRSRVVTVAVALAVASLALTACSGSSIDGTYYVQDINNSSDLGQLVVNGEALTHHEYTCDGVYEEPDVTSTGEFNEDRTQVLWSVAGGDMRNKRTGTESVTISGTSISIDGDVYVRDDSDAGEALLALFEADCTG